MLIVVDVGSTDSHSVDANPGIVGADDLVELDGTEVEAPDLFKD
jgi:hypothetical protein